ncbi:hypothetical protein VTJ83DRAFT_2133 [Remersonia thermophila]|uniref:WD40 repeat-like protein n=1 Tax=Remersonia thermophila TaxID=72144 RepID=A0ABR4DI19_9PEZI
MGSRAHDRPFNLSGPSTMGPAALEDPLDGDDADMMGGAPLHMSDDSPCEVASALGTFGGHEGEEEEEYQDYVSSSDEDNRGDWGPQAYLGDYDDYDDDGEDNNDETDVRAAGVNRLDDDIAKILGLLDASTEDEHEEEEEEEEEEDGDDDDDDNADFWEEDYGFQDHTSCPFHHYHHHYHHQYHHHHPHAADDDDDDDDDDEDLDTMLYDTSYAPFGAGIDGSDDDGLSVLAASHGPHLGPLFWEAPSTYDAPPLADEPHIDPPAIVANMIQQVAAFYNMDANPDSISFQPFSSTSVLPHNHSLTGFLLSWVDHSRSLRDTTRGRCPFPSAVDSLKEPRGEDDTVYYDDLDGDRCDFQGINWEEIGVERRDARERRLLTYSNYVNVDDSDKWKPDYPDVVLPARESFFRFSRMDIKRNISLSHFQLRHIFAAASRSRVFYPVGEAVEQFNPVSNDARQALKFPDGTSSQISTLAAGHGMLVAGGFSGEYLIRRLDSGEPDHLACSSGTITTSIGGITNHVAIYQPRASSGPVAAFASNDNRIRVMDLATETWLSEETYDFLTNCSAVSPDGRLRVVVGDSVDVLVTAADPGQVPSGSGDAPSANVLHRLSGHRDYGFACDWAGDGWTFATAFQDKTVRVWDARRLTDNHTGRGASVCTIRSDMAGARSLKFSPIGSGPRVLVAAEEADYISVIDARTFRSKQTFDVFGELGGLDFADGGRELMVLCCDPARGGILHFERCAAVEAEATEELAWDDEGLHGVQACHYRRGKAASRRPSSSSSSSSPSWAAAGLDWRPSIFTETARIKGAGTRWRKRIAASTYVEPF